MVHSSALARTSYPPLPQSSTPTLTRTPTATHHPHHPGTVLHLNIYEINIASSTENLCDLDRRLTLEDTDRQDFSFSSYGDATTDEDDDYANYYNSYNDRPATAVSQPPPEDVAIVGLYHMCGSKTPPSIYAKVQSIYSM